MVNPGSFPGSRGDFIISQTKLYADAVKDGHISDTVADIQRRFLKRYPVTLRDDEEPSKEWLAQVDDGAPEADIAFPNVEGMDEHAAARATKEYQELAQRTKFKKEQIKRRLHYIYCKNRDAESDSGKSSKDPLSGITSKLLGVDMKLPRKRTAYNVWGPKNRDAIDPIFDARVKELGAGKEKHAAIRSAVYKEQFEALPTAEQDKWTLIATREHEKAVQDVKARYKNSIPTSPADRQRVISELPKFVEPILDAIAQHTGWKASFIAGGPEPADGGRLNMISIHSGVMPGTVKMDFGRAEHAAYKASIAPAFGNFLKKSYTVQECRARALPKDNTCISINDIAGDGNVNMDVYSFEADRQEVLKDKPKRLFEEIAKSGKSNKPVKPPTGTPSPLVRFGPPIGKKKNRELPSKDASRCKLGPSPLSRPFFPGDATSSESAAGTTSTTNTPQPSTDATILSGVTVPDPATTSSPKNTEEAADAVPDVPAVSGIAPVTPATPRITNDGTEKASNAIPDAPAASGTSSGAPATSSANPGVPAMSGAGAVIPATPIAANDKEKALSAIPDAPAAPGTSSGTPTMSSANPGAPALSGAGTVMPATPIAANNEGKASSADPNTPAASGTLSLTPTTSSATPTAPVTSDVASATPAHLATNDEGKTSSANPNAPAVPGTSSSRPVTSSATNSTEHALSATPNAPATSGAASEAPAKLIAANDEGKASSANLNMLAVAGTSSSMPATSSTANGTERAFVAAPDAPAMCGTASEVPATSSRTANDVETASGATPNAPAASGTTSGMPATYNAGISAPTIPHTASTTSTTPVVSTAAALNPVTTPSAKSPTACPAPPSPRQSLPPSPQGSPQRRTTPIPPAGTAMVPDPSQIVDTPVKSRKRKRAQGKLEDNDDGSASKASKRPRLAVTAQPTQPTLKRKAGPSTNAASKRQRINAAPPPPGGEQPFSFVVPEGCPKWVRKALLLLTSHDLGQQWRELVGAWVRFEKDYSFEEKHKPFLPSVGRPEVIGEWIKRAREETYRPDLDDLDAFNNSFNTWWSSLQPEWRIVEGRGLRLGSGGEDWDALRHPGNNGILSAVAGLFFWGYSGCSNRRTASNWDAAVADVLHALEAMTNSN